MTPPLALLDLISGAIVMGYAVAAMFFFRILWAIWDKNRGPRREPPH